MSDKAFLDALIRASETCNEAWRTAKASGRDDVAAELYRAAWTVAKALAMAVRDEQAQEVGS